NCVFTECLFELKMATKSLLRESKKCEKEEKVQKAKLKAAIQKNNMEVYSYIHKINIIQCYNNLTIEYELLEANALFITNNMSSVTKNMEATMRSMNLEKISNMMDRFETQFENLDIQSHYMENAMSGTTQQFAPQDEVHMLMQKTAEEAGLDMNLTVPNASNQSLATSTASTEQDELSQRLARLRE
uniref:Charged multivesicular body protein 1a n=1 Tax=Ciona savignyi TaxID=51511 RepID=H2YN81_CIOSA